jgi:HEAT repeats
LLGLAMKPGPFRDLMGEMFRHQSAGEIASCMLAGSFGRNMLSLSSAIASLPLDRLDEAVRAQVHAMLPKSGHSELEGRFLDHMIEVRKRSQPEPSLAASSQTYLAVAQAGAIRQDDLDKARLAVEASGAAIDAAGVRTMLTLLDQQTEPERTRECAINLASLVGHLLGGHQVMLADYVVAELSARSDRVDAQELLTAAISSEALGALVDAVIADPSVEMHASRIARVLDDSTHIPLVTQAVMRKADGIRTAEKLIGKSAIEALDAVALHAEWYQLRYITARLVAEGDSHSVGTVEALLRRPDTQARKEVVAGLALAGGTTAQRILGVAVNDSSPEVAIAAARALAKSGLAGSADPIAARIVQLDLDNADFELGRELIEALALTPDRSADELLAKLASRRSLMKRGRFNEVQQIVAGAVQVRAREAVGR